MLGRILRLPGRGPGKGRLNDVTRKTKLARLGMVKKGASLDAERDVITKQRTEPGT